MLGYDSPEELVAAVSDIGQQLHVDPARRSEFVKLLQDRGVVERFEAQVYRKDRSVIWISLNASAVWDAAGALLYYEGNVEDITERKRVEKVLQLRASQQATVAALGHRALEITNFRQLREEASRLVAQSLEVEYCAVWQLEAGGGKLLLQAGVGWKDGCMGQATMEAGADSLAGYVLLSQGPVTVEDFATERRFRVPPLLHDHGVTSGAGVAIQGKEGPFGALIAYTARRRTFTQDDVHFLQGVANVLATAAERRRVERERRATREQWRVARAIQKKLFPQAGPRRAGFDFGGRSHPAQATGGDYFDFIPMLDLSTGVVIGDVSGHGFGPALVMAEARAYLRAFTQTHAGVSEILTLANRVLTEDMQEDRFISVLFAKLSPATRSLVYVSAGHPPGYILGPSGDVKRTLESTTTPLALSLETEFPAVGPLTLEPGDTILLLTDGVADARGPDGTFYGESRALETVRRHRHDTAQHIVDRLHDDVRDFIRAQPPTDDVTAVVVKVEPGAG